MLVFFVIVEYIIEIMIFFNGNFINKMMNIIIYLFKDEIMENLNFFFKIVYVFCRCVLESRFRWKFWGVFLTESIIVSGKKRKDLIILDIW